MKPTTLNLLKEGILFLENGRKGCSVPALKKWLEEEKDVEIKQHVFRAAIKRGCDIGELIKVKYSYRLSPEAKKEMTSGKKTSKKSTVAKKAGGKTTNKKKVATSKKTPKTSTKKKTQKKKATKKAGKKSQ